MSYLSLARKWRPLTFEDLVGQNHVVKTLKNSISLGRIHPAYLLSGPKGTGKTSIARIFAKSLRCTNAKEGEPCNTCGECTLISESRSVDVLEIDGASNNGVEQVRAIRETATYGASSGKHKIYIIDEVHMLSTSAFNALLKTLEEPPPNVIFVFATTEAHKIPETIFSRCQRFEFKRLSQPLIVARLKQILVSEDVRVAEGGLRQLASSADGSLRDALSLLDQAVSYYGGRSEQELTESQIVDALGVPDTGLVSKLLVSMIEENIHGIFDAIEIVYQSGIDPKHFAERLLEEVRLLYLVSIVEESGETLSPDRLEISADHFEQLRSLLPHTSALRLERMAQILNHTISQLNYSSLPRLLLEMATVRMAKLKNLEKVEAALESASPDDSDADSNAPQPTVPSPPSDAEEWKHFVESTMKQRPLIGALLSHANFRFERQGNATKIFINFAKDSFYQKQATDPRNQKDIETLASNFFANATECVISTDIENSLASLEAVELDRVGRLRQQALEHPTVLKTQKVLGAEVVEVRVDP